VCTRIYVYIYIHVYMFIYIYVYVILCVRLHKDNCFEHTSSIWTKLSSDRMDGGRYWFLARWWGAPIYICVIFRICVIFLRIDLYIVLGSCEPLLKHRTALPKRLCSDDAFPTHCITRHTLHHNALLLRHKLQRIASTLRLVSFWDFATHCLREEGSNWWNGIPRILEVLLHRCLFPGKDTSLIVGTPRIQFYFVDFILAYNSKHTWRTPRKTHCITMARCVTWVTLFSLLPVPDRSREDANETRNGHHNAKPNPNWKLSFQVSFQIFKWIET